MGLLDTFLAYKAANTPRNTRPRVSPAKVIDQGLLGGAIGRVPDNAQAMYQGLLNAPQELAQLGGKGSLESVNQAMRNPQQANPQQWMDKGMELTGMAPVGGLIGATVYHGSPHKFSKFDMSKIGTGEGNQAYGHGLYFAEAPEVAEGYARNLSMRYTGETMPQLKARMKQIKDTMQGPSRMTALNEVRGQMALAKSGAGKTPQMYKVDIPDEAIPKMLDWDAPLSKQPQNVIDAIQGTRNMLPPNAIDDMGGDLSMLYDMSRNPDSFLADLAAIGGRQDFGETLLRQQGIPGIKYLDGNSRGVGGTSNYVLFDDKMARILEVNGHPTGLLSWADEAKKAKK